VKGLILFSEAGRLEEGTLESGEVVVGTVARDGGFPNGAKSSGELWRGGDPKRDGAPAFLVFRVNTIGEVDRKMVTESPRASSAGRKVSVMVRDGDRGREERVVSQRRGKENPV
jgi:hypothetical protein